MVKVIFHTIKEKKLLSPSGSKFFSLRKVPILKRDAIEENQLLIQ